MGTDKATLTVDGATLLDRVIAVLAASVEGPVLVVHAAGRPLRVRSTRAVLVADAHADRGPLEGLASGLAAAAAHADAAVVAATDLPQLAPSVVRLVLDRLDADHDAVVPRIGGFPHPLTAAYRTTVAGHARALVDGGERSLRGLLATLRVRWLDEATLLADGAVRAQDPALRSFVDVDTPQDLGGGSARSGRSGRPGRA